MTIPENHSTKTSKETRNKNGQVDLHPSERTWSNQTDERLMSSKEKTRDRLVFRPTTHRSNHDRRGMVGH